MKNTKHLLVTIMLIGIGFLSACGVNNSSSMSITPAPTVTIVVSPTSITAGQSATLTWSSTNAASCNASGSWSGTQPTSGSETVTANTVGTDTFTLACNGAGGTASSSTLLGINPKPIIITGLSTSTPTALGPLYISTSGLDATQPLLVMLTNASGYAAVLTPLRVQSDGTVVVAMPLFIDPTTGKTNSLAASLNIMQGTLKSLPVSLTIQDIPQLSDYGTTLGTISRAFYNYQIMTFGRMLNGLQAMDALPGNAVSTTTIQTNVTQQLLNAIKARNDIDRIITTNTLEIGTGSLPDGTSISFNSTSLEMLDRVIGVHLTVLQPSITTAAAIIKHAKIRMTPVALQPGTTAKTLAGGTQGIITKSAINITSIIDAIGLVNAGETVAGTVRTNLQSDPTLADRILSIGSGLSAVVGVTAAIAGAPEVVAAALTAGIVIGAASVLNDAYHIATDFVNIQTLSNSGGDPLALTKAQNDLKASEISLGLDGVSTLLGGLSVPAQGAASLGQNVVNFLEQNGAQLGIQGAAFLDSTLQLYFQNIAITDQQNAEAAAAQLATPFGASSQGFGTVDGTVDITNTQGPILSGLTGISIGSTLPAQFFSIADENGNYSVLVPLGSTLVNYPDSTVNAVDPISGLVLSTSPFDLSGLTSQSTPFLGPTLTGVCIDTDAGDPDSDDPDCD